MPMEMGRNLEHTTERHQRGFKVPMEMGSQKRGVHVRTCRDTPPMITACTTINGTTIAYQISAQSAQPLPSSNRRKFLDQNQQHGLN